MSSGSIKSYVIEEDAWVTSFRTHPHPSASTSVEITDVSVDPYAYFLNQESKRKYHARLSERGLLPLGRPDNGHPFESVKRTQVGDRFDLVLPGNISLNGYNLYARDNGSLDSTHLGGIEKNFPSLDRTFLNTWAQQAYSRAAPTDVVFDAAQFLGELREGLPRISAELMKDTSSVLRGLGGQYLNVQFGWKPFVSDILNAATALAHATQQLRRNGGRVHRRYEALPITRAGEYNNTSSGNVALVGAQFAQSPGTFVTPFGSRIGTPSFSSEYSRATLTKSARVERWFEGEFTSFFPLGFNPDSFMDRFNVLVNTKLTPEVLWELAPWSWLVDWNLAIGSTIKANQKAANDLLVMHYGYAMERITYVTSSSIFGPIGSSAQYLPQKANMYQKIVSKRRIRANPYGFRVTADTSFSIDQLAILGALGLTKAK